MAVDGTLAERERERSGEAERERQGAEDARGAPCGLRSRNHARSFPSGRKPGKGILRVDSQ